MIRRRDLLKRNRNPRRPDVRAALADISALRTSQPDHPRRPARRRDRTGGSDDGRSRLIAPRLSPPPRWHRPLIQPRSKNRARAGAGAAPRSLQTNRTLDAWLRINATAASTVFTGKVELGQGIVTALAQIAAEELEVPLGASR